MEFLEADQVRPEPGERVFRHGRSGTLVMFLVFGLPLPLGIAAHRVVLPFLGALPWPVWIVLGPVLLFLTLFYPLLVLSLLQFVRRSFLSSNWLMRVSPSGVVLNLRSYQNAHFPHDGPTVVRIAWQEIRFAREVRDVAWRRSAEAIPLQRRWLQLELARPDAALEALLRMEHGRGGPPVKRFGITSSTRSAHAPVFVVRPGVLRTDWLGAGMLRALDAHGSVGARLELGREPGLDAAARIAELVRRGDLHAATMLVRRRLGFSRERAREYVRELVQHQDREAA